MVYSQVTVVVSLLWVFEFFYLNFVANGGGGFQSRVDLQWSGCGFRCYVLVCYGFFEFGFC